MSVTLPPGPLDSVRMSGFGAHTGCSHSGRVVTAVPFCVFPFVGRVLFPTLPCSGCHGGLRWLGQPVSGRGQVRLCSQGKPLPGNRRSGWMDGCTMQNGARCPTTIHVKFVMGWDFPLRVPPPPSNTSTQMDAVAAVGCCGCGDGMGWAHGMAQEAKSSGKLDGRKKGFPGYTP